MKVVKKTGDIYSVEGDLTFLTINEKILKSFDFIEVEKKVCLNLSKINLADSAGLAFLIELLKKSKSHQTNLKFSHVPQQLLTLATLSGFDMHKYLDNSI